MKWRFVMAAAGTVVACSGAGRVASSSDGSYVDSSGSGSSKSSGDDYGALLGPSEGVVEETGMGGGAGSSSELFVPANPFVVTAHDPLSTFAADVDTASYDIYRQYAASGSVPDADLIRLEEFVNYFGYDYPAPKAEDETPFAIHLEASAHLGARQTKLLRVGIQGKVVPPEDKKPTNLVFLVDVSGSMSSNMGLVKDVMHRTVDLLEPADTIALVTYAGASETPLPATPVDDGTEIDAAIDTLESGGGTNGEGGILAAYAQAESVFIPDGVNHIVILTDGDFNIGISDPVALEELIVDKRKGGITLTVVGFGYGNTNDEMMERIARSGNGIYGYVGDTDDAQSYVEERMLQSLQHIAKDMKLQVEFNSELVYAYRLLGYEDRDIADEDFRDDVVDAGEIGSGHRVTALYEVALNELELPSVSSAPPLDDGAGFSGDSEVAAGDLVRVKVRYKLPGALETDPAMEVSSSLEDRPIQESFGAASRDLQWAAAVATFAEILKGSPYASAADLETVESIFEAQAEQDEDRSEFYELFQRIRPQLQ